MWEQLLQKESSAFASRIAFYLEELELLEVVSRLTADHIAVRLRDISTVDRLKNELVRKGYLLSSAVVNGREIDIFELDLPVMIGRWRVPCIELPYPSQSHFYNDGLEHIEFVIPGDVSSVEELRALFGSYFPDLNIDELKSSGQYSESVPQAESDQLPNPTICLRKELNLAVKFHAHSIKEVVLKSV